MSLYPESKTRDDPTVADRTSDTNKGKYTALNPPRTEGFTGGH